MIQKMGSLKDLVDKLPLGGMFPGGLPEGVNLDDRELVRIEAIIQSMTRFEKADPYALIREPKRVERISKGSGNKPEAVNELVQKFLFMKQMMGGFGQNMGGMMGKIPGMKQAAMARNMKNYFAGKGTMVRIEFAATLADVAPRAVGRNMPIGPLRILIIDDDPMLLKSLRDALEADGHEVVSAGGGQAGINAFVEAHAEGRPFPVVITDLGMPHVDGRKVASTIKASAPATVVLMLTGWGRRLVAEGDIPSGVDEILSKPPRLAELRAAINSGRSCDAVSRLRARSMSYGMAKALSAGSIITSARVSSSP